ncbi:hypothetical protein [Mucilaginibacter lappiensis]|jgi:hypothetical protein|uniref:hypothetical protein n=1 Tax=Mucilaginibacter lappiensis TaxID=354630 RepID=UPI003D1EBAB7
MSNECKIRLEWIPAAYKEVVVKDKSTAKPVVETAPSYGSTRIKCIYKRNEKLAKGRK